MSKSSQMPDGRQRPAPAFYPDRIDVRTGIALEDDEGQPPANAWPKNPSVTGHPP